jgi:hypothetical protein
MFKWIAKRAEIGRIVRHFDNMRVSRAMEVYREYGAIAESVWLGYPVSGLKLVFSLFQKSAILSLADGMSMTDYA